MSENDTPQEVVNEQLLLISGESGTGKSMSLRNIRNQERWLYLNCEAGKRLPFKNNFHTIKITDPYHVLAGFDHVNRNPDYDGIIVDTVTFLMDMFESKYIVGSSNTMQGWANYNQFFKTMMQDKVANSDKSVLMLAHTKAELDESAGIMRSAVPVKGALKNQGIEAYFSTVVSTKTMPLRELEKYKNDLLNITEQDEMLGFKHVFQTQLTKATVGERIRSPWQMFSVAQTFTDNDAQRMLDHLKQYYG